MITATLRPLHPQGREPVPMVHTGRRVGLRACSDGCGKYSLSTGFDPRIVHTVASSYIELVTYNNDNDYDDDDNNNNNYRKQLCLVLRAYVGKF